MKPPDWPRYMVARRLADGSASYFWALRRVDREAGCALEPTPLGGDYGAARARAEELNAALDAWRTGKGGAAVPMRVGVSTGGCTSIEQRRSRSKSSARAAEPSMCAISELSPNSR